MLISMVACRGPDRGSTPLPPVSDGCMVACQIPLATRNKPPGATLAYPMHARGSLDARPRTPWRIVACRAPFAARFSATRCGEEILVARTFRAQKHPYDTTTLRRVVCANWNANNYPVFSHTSNQRIAVFAGSCESPPLINPFSWTLLKIT